MGNKQILRKSLYQAGLVQLIGMAVLGVPYRLLVQVPGDTTRPAALVMGLLTTFALTLLLFFASGKAAARRGAPHTNMLFIPAQSALLNRSWLQAWAAFLLLAAFSGIVYRLLNPQANDSLVFLAFVNTMCFVFMLALFYVFNLARNQPA